MPDQLNMPDIATIASLIGERARAAMLMNLVGGRALTATELARAAGVTKQTASAHLAKLRGARLVTAEHVGRNHYFRLAGNDVAGVIERLMGLAHRAGPIQVRTGPPDPLMRKARVCYDHLAGELGVFLFDRLVERRGLRVSGKMVTLTASGEKWAAAFGLDLGAVAATRRPLCLSCLDWSARKPHLAGALGAALLEGILERGWARRMRGSRVLAFSASGERALRAAV